jgi:hypothetical protein
LSLTNASTYFALNDVIEVGDDGVARTVTAVTASTVTISPALSTTPPLGTHVDNWGAGATDLHVDMRLRPASPCIDAANNAAIEPDAADVDGDGNLAESIPLDYFGNARFVNDVFVTDTGAGTAPLADIGAVERPAP